MTGKPNNLITITDIGKDNGDALALILSQSTSLAEHLTSIGAVANLAPAGPARASVGVLLCLGRR